MGRGHFFLLLLYYSTRDRRLFSFAKKVFKVTLARSVRRGPSWGSKEENRLFAPVEVKREARTGKGTLSTFQEAAPGQLL